MESMVYVCMVTIVSCYNIFNDMYMRAIPVYLESFLSTWMSSEE